MVLRALAVTLVLAGNAADYVSTRYGLAIGAQERNAVIRRFGLLPVKTVATATQVGACLYLAPTLALTVGVAAAVIYGGAFVWNLRVITRAGGDRCR